MSTRVVRGDSARATECPTSLNASHIEVMPRIGWVLRAARTTAGGAPGLEEMARRVGSNTTRLHRLETGLIRSGDLVDAYEEALGLRAGSLRAPIDVTCRRFPEAPTDRAGASHITSVAELSNLTERLLAPGPVPADSWLRWSRALAQPGAIGLLESITFELILRLINELNRSVGHAAPVRYEALALLRCSDYGHLVLLAARQLIADPRIQLVNDMMGALGERQTPETVSWCLDLLEDPRENVVEGAARALENMGSTGSTPRFWPEVVDRLIEIHNAHDTDTPGWAWRSHALRLVPDSVMLDAAGT